MDLPRKSQLAAGAAALALGLALSLAQATPAAAWGAIAVGKTRDVAADGIAIGHSHRYGDESSAKLRALEECLKFTDAPDKTRVQCRVLRSHNGQCLALALDPKAGTPGWGYAIASSGMNADREALQACRDTAGSNRAEYCEIVESHCDR